MNFTPKEIKELVEKYLDVLYPNARNIEINFLVRDKEKDIWKVNIEFKKHYGDFSSYALIQIESDGEITAFKEGWRWQY